MFVNNYIHVLNEKVVVIGKSCDMPAGLWERLCAYKPEDGKTHVFCMPSEDVAIDSDSATRSSSGFKNSRYNFI